ncbi:MAG: HPr family phosphocarrier protein [Lachnospiraceae bacterium]
MKRFTCMIEDPLGIHARTVALLAGKASKYSCKIMIEANGERIEATDLIGIMGLGVKYGQRITVELEGDDEEAAYVSFQSFFKIRNHTGRR